LITKKNWQGVLGIVVSWIAGIWSGGLLEDWLQPNWTAFASTFSIFIAEAALTIYFLSLVFED
jgi:hypothetical protein